MRNPTTDAQETTFSQDLIAYIRHRVGTRRFLLLAGAIIIVAALALNWSTLVAAGIAPILIAVLPCAVMCGLGLCMHKLGGNSCASQRDEEVRSSDQPEITPLDNDDERRGQ